MVTSFAFTYAFYYNLVSMGRNPELSDNRFVIESKYYKGIDVATKEAAVIRDVALLAVDITPNHLPPFTLESPYVWESLAVSVRSRYAQVGLDIPTDSIRSLFEAKFAIGEDNSSARIVVLNHGTRPVRIEKGARPFRLYTDSAKHAEKGEGLVSLIGSEVGIEGKEGADWLFGRDGEGIPNGVYVRINPESRRWMPPNPDNSEIDVDETVTDYRPLIDPLLEPIQTVSNGKKRLIIAETEEITLSRNVDAIVDDVVHINDRGHIRFDTGKHTNSRVLDGGKTHWPVRIEMVSEENSDNMPNFVRFYFVRTAA